ncbi:mitotic spindle checkpoint protein [Niveomyces insectorum RCEF 264]|uniref:Mitotic spindle checkpoint protein n=1 Tax=Niveomyces insectorum RCEF 264 TaxID=1081102 RepID=A0A167PVP0_9HYPO|nr:mitotic spindle checkpoint protein [Niveomyces insectorum RCEF 264]
MPARITTTITTAETTTSITTNVTMTSLSLDDATALYSVLHDFFEVAVHAILYYRRLYPERAFLSATAFDVPVHQNRHPQVCAWIRDGVDQVLVQLAGGTGVASGDDARGSIAAPSVETVAVVVHAPYTRRQYGDEGKDAVSPGAALERWVFDVRNLPKGWPGGADALKKVLGAQAKKGSDTEGGVGGGGGGGSGGGGGGDGTRGPQHRRQRVQGQQSDRQDDAEPDSANAAQQPAHYEYYDEEAEYANAASEAELDDTPDDDETHSNGDADDADSAYGTLNWTDLRHQLRAVVQRLGHAGAQLAPLPPGCTFTMAIELGRPPEEEKAEKGEKQSKMREMDTHWIPEETDRRRQPWAGGGSAEDVAAGVTTTIRSVDTPPLFLECWVEESAAKRRANSGSTADAVAASLPPASGSSAAKYEAEPRAADKPRIKKST